MLVAHTEESTSLTTDTKVIFRLSELVKMYDGKMGELGTEVSPRTNGTRIKEQSISLVPGLEAHYAKNRVVLSFKSDPGDMLSEASQTTFEDNAIILMKAANTVRKDYLRFSTSLMDTLMMNSMICSLNNF